MGKEVIEKLRRRQFTEEFKLGAVKMVKDQGLDRAEAGKRLGVEPRLIRAWEQAYEAGRLGGGQVKRAVSGEQQEIAKLRAELSRVRMENAILKKAAAYFAKESV
jgi:transposase